MMMMMMMVENTMCQPFCHSARALLIRKVHPTQAEPRESLWLQSILMVRSELTDSYGFRLVPSKSFDSIVLLFHATFSTVSRWFTTNHQSWPLRYQGGSQSLGKYQNFANSAHMCLPCPHSFDSLVKRKGGLFDVFWGTYPKRWSNSNGRKWPSYLYLWHNSCETTQEAIWFKNILLKVQGGNIRVRGACYVNLQ